MRTRVKPCSPQTSPHSPTRAYLNSKCRGRGARWRFDRDLYREPFVTVTRAMYLWRCGTAVSATHHGTTFAHAACHTDDAWLDYVGSNGIRRDATGGWHDAGDYNKYVVNAGVTMGCGVGHGWLLVASNQ